LYGRNDCWIGLISDGEKRQPWHRQQVADNLNAMVATEKTPGNKTDTNPIQFQQIVTATGELGAGISRKTKIIRE
jgi:hypothetical protein